MRQVDFVNFNYPTRRIICFEDCTCNNGKVIIPISSCTRTKSTEIEYDNCIRMNEWKEYVIRKALKTEEGRTALAKAMTPHYES